MSLCCRAAVGVSATLAADLLLRVDGVNCLRPNDDSGIYTLDGRHVTSDTVIVNSVPILCFVIPCYVMIHWRRQKFFSGGAKPLPFHSFLPLSSPSFPSLRSRTLKSS